MDTRDIELFSALTLLARQWEENLSYKNVCLWGFSRRSLDDSLKQADNGKEEPVKQQLNDCTLRVLKVLVRQQKG